MCVCVCVCVIKYFMRVNKVNPASGMNLLDNFLDLVGICFFSGNKNQLEDFVEQNS